MKTVFACHEVAHIWAQRNPEQTSGRSAGSKSAFFEGNSLYSYGYHYKTAMFVTGKRKAVGVLVNSDRYSTTTGQRRSEALQAVSQYKPNVFVVRRVANSKEDIEVNLEDYAERILEATKTVAMARQRKDLELGYLQRLVDEANRYASFSGSRRKFKVNADLDAIRESVKQINAKERANAKIAAEKERIREQERIDKWLAGETVYGYNRSGETLLRVKGDVVETSRGASFPRSHARLGLALVRRTVASGQPWQSNGHTCHLGHYKIDRIEADGTVRAGCHVVTLEAIERIASQL